MVSKIQMLIIFSGIRNLEIEPISGKKVVLPVFFSVTALLSHNNCICHWLDTYRGFNKHRRPMKCIGYCFPQRRSN